MKTVEGVVFRKSWNRKFCKVHRMTSNQTQGIGHQKSTLHMYICALEYPESQIFVRLALQSAVFEIIVVYE